MSDTGRRRFIYNLGLLVVALLVLWEVSYIPREEINIDLSLFNENYRLWKIRNPLACFVAPKTELHFSRKLHEHFRMRLILHKHNRRYERIVANVWKRNTSSSNRKY